MAYLILVILAFSWIVPDHYPPWTAFHTEIAGFLVGVSALFASARGSVSSVKIPSAIVFIALLAVSAWIQLWSGLLVYAGDAIVVSTYLVAFAAAWLWGYQWVATSQKQSLIEYISAFLIFVGFIVAFQIAVQWLQLEYAYGGWIVDGLKNGRPRANIGQPNQAGTVLIMASIGVAVLRHRQRVRSWVMWPALIAFMSAIVLTQSRTALLSAAVLAILFLVRNSETRSGGLQRKHVALWALLLFVAAWLYSNITLPGVVTPVAGEQMFAIGTRPQIWKQLLAALYENPWVGWGWLQIAAATQSGALVFPGVEQATYAHNIILDTLIMLGVPLGCLILLCIGRWCWGRWRYLNKTEAAGCAVFILIPFFLHSLLEFPHVYIYFLIVVGLLFGAVDAWTENGEGYFFRVPKITMLCAGFIFSVIQIGLFLEYMAIEEDFRINRFENVRLGEFPQNHRPPSVIFLTQLDELGKAMRLRAKPEMKEDDIELLKRVSRRYSWVRLMFRTALALGLNGRSAEATQQLRVIKGLFSAEVYLEAKESFLSMQREEYPQLKQVELP